MKEDFDALAAAAPAVPAVSEQAVEPMKMGDLAAMAIGQTLSSFDVPAPLSTAASLAAPAFGALQLAGAGSFAAPAQVDASQVVAAAPVAARIASVSATATTAFAPPQSVDTSGMAAPADLGAIAGVSPFEDGARLFRLYTLLADDKRLYLETMHGVEEVGTPFHFDLRLVSRNASIELKELISSPVTIGIVQTDGSERYLNGYVSTFAFERNDAGWAGYRATLVPWTHFLTLRQDSRIFQQLTIPQIVEKIFGEYGATADFQWRLQRSYTPWDFIVQYAESDFNFVSRLIEREGWSYFWDWRADGHTLVITDDTPNEAYCTPLPLYPDVEFNGGNRTSTKNSVTDFQAVRELQPGKVTVDTYDYQSPRGLRLAEVPTVADQGSAPKLEVFDGTPGYAYRNRSEGERYAKQRMEGYEARAKFFHGRTDCPDFRAGRTVALNDHHWFDDAERDRLLLLRVEHFGRNNIVPEQIAEYSAQFACQRRSVPYRPEALHDRPSIAGLQTATVTGPPGEEIWTNKHGCIKVRFHWDRRAPFDQSSSCWIRVSQPWAGEGWGTIAIPRIGQEVIVGFMEGDPDRPMVLGSVFNTDQPAPYGLPAAAHMMGFKSNSTPGGGGYSEMVIHDTKGNELVNIHAQKNMVTKVLNDQSSTILHNQATVVQGPQQTINVTTGLQATVVKKSITVQSEDEHINTQAKTSISMKAETEHVVIEAATDLVLVVGQSKLHMNKDGSILLEGVHITVKGSGRVDINP